MHVVKKFENRLEPPPPAKRSWVEVYYAIKADPNFMSKRDRFPPQEREDL